MRGLLVVNPKATTTSPRVTDVLVRALSSDLNLSVITTEHPGHAIDLGRQARREGLDIVVTLGGDGVIHEAVNGLLDDDLTGPVPLLATIPGGSGNVFARALGLAADPVEATGQVLEAVRAERSEPVSLGRVNGTWFIANAGLGIDAEVIEAMNAQRRAGKRATPARYLWTTVSQVASRTDRQHPALHVHRAGRPPIAPSFLVIVQNTRPWTYLGEWPVDPCPQASFDEGLDMFALHRLDPWATARAARRMLWRSRAGTTKHALTVWHDQAGLTVTADRPTPMQIDGEAVGTVTCAVFESVPHALHVVR